MTSPDPTYLKLRDTALDLSAADLDLPESTPVVAAFVEFELGDAVATLVCIATGDASLYYSTGGGRMGGGGIPAVKEAALRLVAAFAERLGHLPVVDHVTLPDADHTGFIALTPDGAQAAMVATSTVDSGHSALAELFRAANAVVTAFQASAES